MSLDIPDRSRRFFAHYDEAETLLVHSPEFVIARLFEEGDGADLRWLTGAVPESRLREWFDRHGGRQLSRRSRTFWRIVLATPESSKPLSEDPLWPL